MSSAPSTSSHPGWQWAPAGPGGRLPRRPGRLTHFGQAGFAMRWSGRPVAPVEPSQPMNLIARSRSAHARRAIRSTGWSSTRRRPSSKASRSVPDSWRAVRNTSNTTANTSSWSKGSASWTVRRHTACARTGGAEEMSMPSVLMVCERRKIRVGAGRNQPPGKQGGLARRTQPPLGPRLRFEGGVPVEEQAAPATLTPRWA